ncbi:MAG: NADH-quinone oxidoreductase subunit NuoG [Caldilineaceae bacterium]|nr:NADH-quinone oxidoreductase subunit NuoG [Caldilineaceae bacterium]
MADNVTLKINDREVTVPIGTLVVDAAAKVNVEIPIFCSHPKLDPVGCCRMCMVEVEGPQGSRLMVACTMPVQQGMSIRTDTEQVRSVQEANLAFILLNHPLDCPICDKGGECPLQDQTMRFGPGISQLVEPKRLKKKHYLISDTIVLDQERCVLCWRCIRYLEEWEDKPQLGLFQRGAETIIDIQDGQPVDAKTSGNIIDICPVGALTNRISRFAFRPWQVDRTPSICNLCSVGCNLRIDSRSHEMRRIIGRENMAVNDIWLCDKGRFAFDWVNHEGRLQMPLVRKNGALTPVQWSEALSYIADKFKAIKAQHGADAIGAIGSGKLSNEANYLLQRFMRQIIGSNNIDHRDGGDVAAIATGLPAIADVMKPQYGPNPTVDTIFLFGVDPSEELPILDVHLKRAVRRGKAKLIIAHPRQVELTRYKGPYLGYKPGSEAALLNGLVKAAFDSGVELKSNRTTGLDDLKSWTANADDEMMQEICGVDPEAVKAAARMLAESENALIVYGPMAGSAGSAVRQGLINLVSLTGHYERLAYVGLDANSQGCRDMGVLPDRLPGHAALDDDNALRRLRTAWGGAQLPTTPGKTYAQMLDAAGDSIKALYVMGANPASERPEWAANLEKLDLLVVQEILDTETVQRADVVLPARSWAEQDGTFTNLERRVQRAPKAVDNPNTRAAPDWMILDHLANRMGVDWPFADLRGVTTEISRTVPIYAGITWDALGDQGVQWDAAKVRPEPVYAQVEADRGSSNADYPLALVTGTVLFDGGTMFWITPELRKIAFDAVVALNPSDADQLALSAGTPVSVISPEGALDLTVTISEQIQPGTAWIPESLPGAPVGTLLNGSVNQHVRIERK